jgi:two-component sensor histidine kinase
MSAAQRVLYDEGSPTRFHAREFLNSVCAAAQGLFDDGVAVHIEAAEGSLSNESAMPLALILNELLTNAAKYGATPAGGATIRVGLVEEEAQFRLWVHDEGPGFSLASAKQSGGLGLITGLARQLRGSFSVESAGGAACTVRFEKH